MRTPTFVVSLVLLFSQAFTAPANAVGIFHENFNDNLRNSNQWGLHLEGTGPLATETNQRLELMFPATSFGSVFRAGYASVFSLEGDFDVQVDFYLPLWPQANGVRVGLAVDSSSQGRDAPVERISFGVNEFPSGGEMYLTHFDSRIKGRIPTTHTSGKLRMTRTGTVLEGYYYDAGSWVFIGDGIGNNNAVNILLMAWSHDRFFADQPVKVVFDDLIVNKGKLLDFSEILAPVPEPASLLLLGMGLTGMAAYGWRRKRDI